MAEYRVIWSIELEAEDEEDAATRALEIMLAPDSDATLFEVVDEQGQVSEVDLREKLL